MAHHPDHDPTVTVGVTGHRPNRLAMTPAAVRRACADLLGAIARHAGARTLVAVSPLAEGADRAFAEAALTCDYRLHAILPFSGRDYETTFADAAQTKDYRRLLARCTDVTELNGQLSRSTDAYRAVGTKIVAAGDIIIAVWDGRPAAGDGGTADVIAMALRAGRPLLWIDARDRQPPRLLRPPSHDADDLITAMGQAIAVDDTALAAVVAATAAQHPNG